ncbi:platelet-activating factor receptor-like [Heterodontus francisci]|uniref:platelet-activating factor receptor-like n=1 Tax=Heterodontus francisci TaxID=7792 RepID=UPI00355BE7CB
MNNSTHSGNCSEEHFYDTSEFRYQFFTIIYSFLFIVGLPENIAALYFLVRSTANKRLTEVKIYMISLTAADLLFVTFLPFWIDYYYREGNWAFASFMCSLCGSLFYINTYNTIFFLAFISFTRYLAVSQPVKTAQSKQIKRGFALTAFIWTITLFFSLPFLIDNESHLNRKDSKISCFENYREGKILILIIHLLMLLGFFLSFGVVIANRVLILRKLSVDQEKLRTSQSRLKIRAFRMVFTVLIIYVICFLPHHLVQLPWVLLVLNFWQSDDCAFRKTVNDVHQVTLCLMCINCILDPILYCFLTENFKQYLKELTQSCRRKYILKSSPKPQEI